MKYSLLLSRGKTYMYAALYRMHVCYEFVCGEAEKGVFNNMDEVLNMDRKNI